MPRRSNAFRRRKELRRRRHKRKRKGVVVDIVWDRPPNAGPPKFGALSRRNEEPMTDPRYSSAQWKRLRKYIRNRDGNVCQIKLPGCKGVATSVDHIREPGPPELGLDYLFFDQSNCRAACRSCNTSKRNRRTSDLAAQALGLGS